MKNQTLTIGIPTFNREKSLENLLNNLIHQIKKYKIKNIKILVSDNSFEDGTKKLIKKKYLRYKFFKYNKNKTNLKFIGNMLKLIELADTDYLWFIGDDDLPKEGIIKEIQSNLNEKENVYIFSKKKLNTKSKLKEFPTLISKYVFPVKKSKKVLNGFNKKEIYVDPIFSHISILVELIKDWAKVYTIKEEIIVGRTRELQSIGSSTDKFRIHIDSKVEILMKNKNKNEIDFKEIIGFEQLHNLMYFSSIDSLDNTFELIRYIEKLKRKYKSFYFNLFVIPFYLPKFMKRILLIFIYGSLLKFESLSKLFLQIHQFEEFKNNQTSSKRRNVGKDCI